MAIWAYECRACGSDDVWLVSRQQVDEVLGPARIVRVRTGVEWKCAVVDRSHALSVEAMLLREVIASDGDDCPECAALLAESAGQTNVEPAQVESASEKAVPTASAPVKPEHVETDGPEGIRGCEKRYPEASCACRALNPMHSGTPFGVRMRIRPATGGVPHGDPCGS